MINTEQTFINVNLFKNIYKYSIFLNGTCLFSIKYINPYLHCSYAKKSISDQLYTRDNCAGTQLISQKCLVKDLLIHLHWKSKNRELRVCSPTFYVSCMLSSVTQSRLYSPIIMFFSKESEINDSYITLCWNYNVIFHIIWIFKKKVLLRWLFYTLRKNTFSQGHIR